MLSLTNLIVATIIVTIVTTTAAVEEVAKTEGLEYSDRTCRNSSLLDTPWPSDHGDSSRTKYTIGAG